MNVSGPLLETVGGKTSWKPLNLAALIVPPPISSAVVFGKIPIYWLKLGSFGLT